MDFWVRCDELYTPFERRQNSALRIIDGKIHALAGADEIPDGAQVVHEPGARVAPGFIDLHVHGARGRDCMEGSREALEAMSAALARHGTTSFLATTLSATDADTETAIRGYSEHHAAILDGARPLGIHMEGPFLSPVRKGTHNAAYLRPADVESFRRFVALSGDSILKITVAPEMDDGHRLIREACGLGIRVSLGHSDATAEEAKQAVNAGATHATHTFNAMRPFHQREPGILGVALGDDRVFAELICDGVHVHPVAVGLLLRMKGAGRTLLVTDGLSAVDMPDGRYPLGDKTVIVQDGECRDPDGTLAGSTLTLDRAVRNLAAWTGAPLQAALAAASSTPARSLGIADRKGVIAPGADADIVFLDGDLKVVRTMVAGRTVYP